MEGFYTQSWLDEGQGDTAFLKPAELVSLPAEMARHEHEHTQIVIGLNGQMEFEVSGIGNIVHPGQGCVVTCGAGHAFGGISQQSDILVLNMPMPQDNEPLLMTQLNELANHDTYFQLDSQIQKLIQILTHEMQANPESWQLKRACNDTLLAVLQRHVCAFQLQWRESRFDIDVIDRYIEKHIAYPITVAQLAGAVFLGESQFYERFKQATKITPHQYLVKKRLDKAKKMLEEGRFTISQISDATGFSSASVFSHIFSRQVGCSPSQYRKRS